MVYKSIKVREEVYNSLKAIDPSPSKAINFLFEGKPSPNETTKMIARLDKHRDKLQEIETRFDRIEEILTQWKIRLKL